MIRRLLAPLSILGPILLLASGLQAQLAIRGETVHTATGAAITDGVVLVADGKIRAVGPASEVAIPEGHRVLRAKVVTPGLIDARSVVGLAGYLNYDHDQDQLERSGPIQPGLRALDAYNARERLVAWVRSFGITTIHTGHAPGTAISGQTLIAKTTGDTVDEAVRVPFAMLAATMGSGATAKGGKAPGTRAKLVAMLREKLIAAQRYAKKRADADESKRPTRDLDLEALAAVLAKERPLLCSVDRAHDIVGALRLAAEFDIRLVLDGAAEAHLVLDKIRAAKVPVLVHAPMVRAWGERENASMTTPARLAAAGIPFAFQSGYESYVPKTRVVLFEAAIAVGQGLAFDKALAALTIEAARILGIDERTGSLAVGKDADLALFDGDPFEYTSHVTGVVIDGRLVSEIVR